MKTARTGERPARHLSLEWTSAEEADQRAIAREAVEALFSVAGEWMEILAIELRAGCCDPDTYTDDPAFKPPEPFHLLVREPRRADISIDPTYRTIETRTPRIDREAVIAVVARILSQTCGGPPGYQIAMEELNILASSIPLPPGWTDIDILPLECYAGQIAIPVEHNNGRPVVAAPPLRYLIPQPVAVSVVRSNDWLRITIDVYWSPWVGELARPDSFLSQGISRLRGRGWSDPE